jgi:DtxR family Mn-dependent transcriptional regulator
LPEPRSLRISLFTFFDRLEHVISEELEARIDEQLGYPTHDPHGDPIPDAGLHLDASRLRSLDALEPGEEATVSRVPDNDSELLRYLAGLRLLPGGRVTMRRAEPFDGPVTIAIEGEDHAISRELAMQIGIA